MLYANIIREYRLSVVHFIYSFLPTFIVSNRSSFMCVCVCVRELGHKMYMETIRLVNSYREIS